MISRQPDGKKYDDHQHFQESSALALGRKQLLEESDRTNFLQRPDDPAGEKDQRHGERQVQIGIRAAEQRLVDLETVGSLVPPANRANPGNQTKPIGGQNEDEDRRQKPKRPLDQMRADDSLQKVVQTFDQPFQEVLGPAGNTFHVARCDSGENYQGDGDNPADDHGIGDEAAPMFNLDGGLRQAVLRLSGKCTARRQ